MEIVNKPLSFLALCLVASNLGGGCAKKADIVGNWKFKEMTGATGVAAQQMANATAVFKDDKTFTIDPGKQPITGTYTFADGKASMTVKSIRGKSVDEIIKEADKLGMGPQVRKSLAAAMVGTVSDDGGTMTVTSGDNRQGSLVFTRA